MQTVFTFRKNHLIFILLTMSNMLKNKLIYISLILSILHIIGCKQSAEIPYQQIEGKAMGTYFSIKVQSDRLENIKLGIDSVLNEFNTSMSLYQQGTTLVEFNNADSIFCYDEHQDPHFRVIFEKSKEIYQLTNGYFDPSISPLVKYYGFGYNEKKKLISKDTVVIKNMLKLLVFDSLTLTPKSNGLTCIKKPSKSVNLDFNAIAKGYGVDLVAMYLEGQNIQNYMVEIGGEVRTKGKNPKGKDWVIGINRPDSTAAVNTIELPLRISNKSLASSGNYRNSYESKGQKFAHIINPKNGMSQPTDILSVTIIADDCMTADALATACMALGLDKAIELIENVKGIDAGFIFDLEGDGVFEFRSTEGFSRYYYDNEQIK